jgi:GntR family transcriptional regulator of arabinose operon
MTKLDALVATLRDEIRQGKYPEGGKFPSEHELARLCGANRITISKAVNLLIQEGYLQRAGSTRAGTWVKSRRPFPDGIIGCLTNLDDSFPVNMFRGAVQAANRNNYLLSIATPEIDEVASTVRKMEEAGFKGILNLHYGDLNTSLPVVYIDSSIQLEKPTSFQVLSDNYNGGCLIARKVLECGHRNVVYVARKHGKTRAEPRNRGVIDTLKKAGLKDAEARCFLFSDSGQHHRTQLLKRILARFPGLTAIMCETDYLAFNMINTGNNLGLDMLGKISVTGFGNVREIRQIHDLVSINQHPFELGERACEKLVGIIEGDETAMARVETLAVEFIDGHSVATL